VFKFIKKPKVYMGGRNGYEKYLNILSLALCNSAGWVVDLIRFFGEERLTFHIRSGIMGNGIVVLTSLLLL
jgi:hypothetical protein